MSIRINIHNLQSVDDGRNIDIVIDAHDMEDAIDTCAAIGVQLNTDASLPTPSRLTDAEACAVADSLGLSHRFITRDSMTAEDLGKGNIIYRWGGVAVNAPTGDTSKEG